jgi:VanZ family protein
MNYKLLVLKTLFWLNLSFIVYASLVPGDGLPGTGLDKLKHFSAYCTLSCLMCIHFSSLWIRIAFFAGAIGLGTGMELAQMHIAGRSASLYDGLTNVAGCSCGVLLYRYVVQTRLKRFLA